jgi:diguanylate cyclase (GGDEF)-like protein
MHYTPHETPREFSSQLRELLQRSTSFCAMAAGHWLALEEAFGMDIFAEALYQLARVEMEPEQARRHLLDIVRHQATLCAALGREVSLVTAASDYCSQVAPLVAEPVLLDQHQLRQKEDFAEHDELTGLLNRRAFNQELPREIERFRRFGQGFALLMVDLDRFKEFNDAHGHLAGDMALREAGRVLNESARLYDRLTRYGGEEFAIILPQTNAQEAEAVAERIRLAMANNLGPVTVSVGVASYPQDGLDMDGLVQSADKALYDAKSQRNSVRRFHDANRLHRRYVLSDPLPLAMHSQMQGTMEATVSDVSFGGLRCRAGAAFQPATPLHLVLSDVARGIHLPLRAEVRRLDVDGAGGYQLGLAFRLESVSDQMKLVALLEGHLGRRAHAAHASVARATA